jgi:DNA polymerase lambda
LDRNQLVGADCFEDFREEMNRSEVEEIGRLIKSNTLRLYPGAEVNVMGSYRRGKATCGDVDVHITHKSYVKKIPSDALGKIVDALWQSGHLAFHLTFITGMATGSSLADYQASSQNLPNDVWEWSNHVVSSSRNKETGASYMGVFRSPNVPMRRRRVDIKLYPYRERIFASLYFTGNGFFNRSMRLWATRKFGYTLNDHGLFRLGTIDRVMEASEEREVFGTLGIVYKEPSERDCFDAVEPIGKEMSLERVELTEAEFYRDNAHAWVD